MLSKELDVDAVKAEVRIVAFVGMDGTSRLSSRALVLEFLPKNRVELFVHEFLEFAVVVGVVAGMRAGANGMEERSVLLLLLLFK